MTGGRMPSYLGPALPSLEQWLQLRVIQVLEQTQIFL